MPQLSKFNPVKLAKYRTETVETLVAGCGTGRDALTFALNVNNTNVGYSILGKVNEYVYNVDEEEELYVEKLKEQIAKNLFNGENPKLSSLLCLATYESLGSQKWCSNLTAITGLAAVMKRQVYEPLEEKKEIPKLTKASQTGVGGAQAVQQ